MKLKAYPYQVFEEKVDPISLYVRRNWLNERQPTHNIIESTIHQILDKQLNDGSWDHYTAHTIENLYALWLLTEKPFDSIYSAVDWLLEISDPPSRLPASKYTDIFGKFTGGEKSETKLMQNVPFTRGCFVYVKTGAALFFAMQYKRQDTQTVHRAYEYINHEAVRGNGRHCSGSCGHNLRLAMAVHPHYRNTEGMHRVLNYLGHHQQSTGVWTDGIPFIPTLYMLSYLNSVSSNTLFEKAVISVQRLQNMDGSWGQTQKERDTFLVMDALQRKGVDWSA